MELPSFIGAGTNHYKTRLPFSIIFLSFSFISILKTFKSVSCIQIQYHFFLNSDNTSYLIILECPMPAVCLNSFSNTTILSGEYHPYYFFVFLCMHAYTCKHGYVQMYASFFWAFLISEIIYHLCHSQTILHLNIWEMFQCPYIRV